MCSYTTSSVHLLLILLLYEVLKYQVSFTWLMGIMMMQVDVTMWGSRLWSCASHVGTEQDCRRRVEMLGPSDFSDAMGAFLRQEVARIFIRHAPEQLLLFNHEQSTFLLIR